MAETARTGKGISIQFFDSEPPFSNFDFIERHFGHSDTLPRIFSQARCHGCKTIVLEELILSPDLVEENEDLRRLSGHRFRSRAFRVSFFRTKVGATKDLRRVKDNSFLGYAIVKKDSLREKETPCHVYESVMKPSHYPNNFIRGTQHWDCSIAEVPFAVTGYLYAQQNKLTNVCAHAAVRTAATRFLNGHDISYRKMNELVGVDHRTRRAESGLSSDEMTAILESAGARCIVGDFTKKKPPVPYQKFIYGSIESGFPAIIFFGTSTSHDSYHAIPVFGHTFNQDTWVPSADRSYFRIGAGTEYIPSDSWLSMFIGHDDNWGSNLCIPQHYLQTKRHPKPAPQPASGKSRTDVESVAFIIATLPKHVEVRPVDAEAIGADYLFTMLSQLPNRTSNPWAQRLSRFARESQLVLRPLLITSEEYTRHLKAISDWEDKPVDRELITLIKQMSAGYTLWMIELSVPELFAANKRKLGEVLLRADTKVGPQRDLQSFFLARLPGYFALYDRGGNSNPKYFFVPSGADGHVQLYGCEKSSALKLCD